MSYTQLGNPYQEFSRGYFAMWITGPWNLGEFRRRLPPELQDSWMTAPVPAPDGQEWPGYSLAGGSSLAHLPGVEAEGRRVDASSSSCPCPRSRRGSTRSRATCPRGARPWEDPSLASDVKARAFRDQLARVTPLPRVPEWEQIAQKVAEDLEGAIRGRETVPAALASLDARRGPHPREAPLDPGRAAEAGRGR